MQDKLSRQLEVRIKADDIVLVSMYAHNPVIFGTGIDLDQLIYEGVASEWQAAQADPERYVDWVLVDPSPRDELHKALFLHQGGHFLDDFELVFQDEFGQLYRRRS